MSRLLDEAAIARLVKSTCDDKLVIAIGEWLFHLNFFSDAQVYAILNFFKEKICIFSEKATRESVTPTSLVVTEARYVTYTGSDSFFDAGTFEPVQELPSTTITHIFCDVVNLWQRMKASETYREHSSNATSTAVAD